LIISDDVIVVRMNLGDIHRGDVTETLEPVAERRVLQVDPGERGSVLFELVERYLAVDWRLPVLFTDGPDESLVLFRLIAEHRIQPPNPFVARHEYKPKRLALRRLHVLEGLPGVGPALARRLLSRFATVEEVMMADEEELASVPGIGGRKAAVIRKLLQS
jgi:hypothetical protein